MLLSPLLFNFALQYIIRGPKKSSRDQNWMGHISLWSMLAGEMCKYYEQKQRSSIL